LPELIVATKEINLATMQNFCWKKHASIKFVSIIYNFKLFTVTMLHIRGPLAKCWNFVEIWWRSHFWSTS